MQTDVEQQRTDFTADGLGNIPPKKPLTMYLAILAGVLVFAVAGFFLYLHQQAARFEAQCQDGEQMALEIKYMMEELKDLPGEKDNEHVKDWLERLDTAKSNMDKLCNDLQGARPSSKYQQARSNLLAAAQLERALLDDVEFVVKDPLSGSVQEKINGIEASVTELHDLAGTVVVGNADFGTAMDMSEVKNNLAAFVGKAKEAEHRRLEEEARIAQEKEKQRLADIQSRQKSHNDSIMANTHKMEWLATGVNYVNSQRLDLHGFFYNGTNNPVVKIDNMCLSITLYKRGEIVYQENTFNFYSPIDFYGAVAPGTKRYNDLYVTCTTEFPRDFDEFMVTTESINWTYVR